MRERGWLTADTWRRRMTGYLSDRHEGRYNRSLITAGLAIAALCSAMLGPSPLLGLVGVLPRDPAQSSTSLFRSEAVMMALLGVSEALVVAPTYPEMLAHFSVG